MVFGAVSTCLDSVSAITLNGAQLKRVHEFKYLGHLVTDDLKDHADVEPSILHEQPVDQCHAEDDERPASPI